MSINGLVRRHRYGYVADPQTEAGLTRREDDVATVLDRPRPRHRREAGLHPLGRTAGVTGAAFMIGFAQGRFGTSQVKGVPVEVVAGGLLHATATLANLPTPAREAMRALGDGALAAAALKLGYQLGAAGR